MAFLEKPRKASKARVAKHGGCGQHHNILSKTIRRQGLSMLWCPRCTPTYQNGSLSAKPDIPHKSARSKIRERNEAETSMKRTFPHRKNHREYWRGIARESRIF